MRWKYGIPIYYSQGFWLHKAFINKVEQNSIIAGGTKEFLYVNRIPL